MRTSGHSRSDVWMSAVPIAVLVVFLVGFAGGLKPALRTLELTLWGVVGWITSLLS